MQKPRDNSNWTRRLTTYAIAGGAAVALAPPVHADIVYVNPTTKPFLSQSGMGTQFLYLDLNGDGALDYEANVGVLPPIPPLILGPVVNADLDPLNGNLEVAVYDSAASNEYVLPIPFGLTVGPVVNLDPYWVSRAEWWAEDAALNQVKIGAESFWPNDLNDPRYVGLQFDISGEMHFGWMLASTAWVYDKNVDNVSSQMEIYSWAYKSDPNTPIVVGATSSEVPEPSSLALCALGAAGIALLKQRRRRARS
ncbi:MAG: PEP-CTERM sorting domain-containing protein [Acidobacteriia bacterium]|nr:PEP-CTERM sorting domain-containing protein [Terriglobia bacterium]